MAMSTLTQFGEHEHSAQLHSLTVNKYIENEQTNLRR